jgi:hypothetical protein
VANIYKSEKRRFWEKHIEKWKESGLSQVEYCRVNDVKIKSFRYWKRRVGRLGCAKAPVEVRLPKALSIPISPAHPQLCLVVGQHYRIEICKGFDSEDLERVVRMLGRI